MAFIKSEDKGKNQHVIEFSIDKETFDAEVTKIFREKSRNITVPGFRRGKSGFGQREQQQQRKQKGKNSFHIPFSVRYS